MSGIGLIFNPRAGKNRRDPGASARLARKLGDNGLIAAPRSLDELARAAEDFHRHKIEVLGIAGGDGTNHVTLTHFHAVYGKDPLPTVALLRGGTMNTVANSLGLPKGRPEGLLDRLIRRYLETPRLKAVEQWTMDINGQLGFLFGMGAITGFLRAYYETGAPSPWTAFKTLTRAIGSTIVQGPMVRRMTQPVVASVVTESGEHWREQPFFALAAGTIPDIGLGFKPFHRAFEVPGLFHLLGVHTTAFGFVADLPRIHRAQGLSPGRSTDALVRSATIHVPSAPVDCMIDGDLVECPRKEIVLRVGPSVRIATMH